MKVAITGTVGGDVSQIIGRMRGLSRDEVERVGIDARAVIDDTIKKSAMVWTGRINGKIACMWGVQPMTIISDRAYLWMITTKAVEEHPFVFLRQSQMVLKELLGTYRVIYGLVDIRFTRSVRWLKWLKFTVDYSGNDRFRYFSMSRD